MAFKFTSKTRPDSASLNRMCSRAVHDAGPPLLVFQALHY